MANDWAPPRNVSDEQTRRETVLVKEKVQPTQVIPDEVRPHDASSEGKRNTVRVIEDFSGGKR